MAWAIVVGNPDWAQGAGDAAMNVRWKSYFIPFGSQHITSGLVLQTRPVSAAMMVSATAQTTPESRPIKRLIDSFTDAAVRAIIKTHAGV